MGSIAVVGKRRLAPASLFVAVAAAACSTAGEGAGEGERECTPLASEPPPPIALATTLGIGRHADGTIYVLDQAGVDYRAFVSAGATLARKPVSGSGSGQQAGGSWTVVTVADTTAPFTLKVDETSGVLRMGVVRGAFSDRDFVIGETGDVLEVQGTEALQGMTILDLAHEVVVEYFAHLPDGRELVVTRPAHDWTYEDFRLYLGTADSMSERRVVSVSRARDGGSTTIVFVLDGGQATAFFPSPLAGGSATLDAGGETITLAVEPIGTAPGGFAFFCL